eukprot:scaffold8690_cov190-Amphora_coffeaeformis.AAC.11
MADIILQGCHTQVLTQLVQSPGFRKSDGFGCQLQSPSRRCNTRGLAVLQSKSVCHHGLFRVSQACA